MVAVVDDVMTYFSSSVAVVLGDLNADCSYFSAGDLANTTMRDPSRWVHSELAVSGWYSGLRIY